MEETVIIKNDVLLNLLNSDNNSEIKDFVSIMEIFNKLSFKIDLSGEELLNEIIDALYFNSRKNEDIRIISKLYDKMFNFIDKDEHNDKIEFIRTLANEEDNSFKNILDDSNLFRKDIHLFAYNLDDLESIRNIHNLEEAQKALLILCNYIEDMKEFLDEVKIILFLVKFDDNVLETMKELNDGFVNRRKEIIYHLYCINREIPIIMQSNPSGYKEIGEKMSINCSRERKREIVNRLLIKEINGINIDCELHTKMKSLSSKAPDRIYFCPSIPDEVGQGVGSIYIYKITKHVK